MNRVNFKGFFAGRVRAFDGEPFSGGSVNLEGLKHLADTLSGKVEETSDLLHSHVLTEVEVFKQVFGKSFYAGLGLWCHKSSLSVVC